MEVAALARMGDVSIPRRHHYVPQVYLAAFTATGEKGGRLHVLDKKSGRSWPSNPADAGCEHDFYMLNVAEDAEHDALALEKFFGQLEGDYREAIRATLDAGNVPADDELGAKLMRFLAAQVLRVPGTLEAWDRGVDQVLRTGAWYMAKTPEEREFVESDDVTFSLDKNTRLGTLLQPLPELAAALGKRHWTLVKAADEAPDFVSSDRPLTVCWTEPTEKRWPPPALGLARTTAMFPVSRRAALLGMFEGPFSSEPADPMLVGIVNMWTGLCATRFLYRAEEDFQVTLPDGRAGGLDDFLRHIGRAART